MIRPLGPMMSAREAQKMLEMAHQYMQSDVCAVVLQDGFLCTIKTSIREAIKNLGDSHTAFLLRPTNEIDTVKARIVDVLVALLA